jgi:hypothetical protein
MAPFPRPLRQHPEVGGTPTCDTRRHHGPARTLNVRTIGGACLVPTDPASWPKTSNRCLTATKCGHRRQAGEIPAWRRPNSVPGQRAAKLSWPGMASYPLDGPDAPACPLLGLAADRRSHFTYPHPGHRCFAKNHAAATDARRQSAYCLSIDFSACDRYRAWQRRAASGRPASSYGLDPSQRRADRTG